MMILLKTSWGLNWNGGANGVLGFCRSVLFS